MQTTNSTLLLAAKRILLIILFIFLQRESEKLGKENYRGKLHFLNDHIHK